MCAESAADWPWRRWTDENNRSGLFKVVMTMHLVADTTSLMRSEIGTIFGNICFETEEGCFPDEGWTDLVVAFSSAWLNALIRIATGSARRESVWFMDGPFRLDLCANAPEQVQISFVRTQLQGESVLQTATASTEGLLRDAVSASEDLLRACEQKGWRDPDCAELWSAADRGTAVLAGGAT